MRKWIGLVSLGLACALPAAAQARFQPAADNTFYLVSQEDFDAFMTCYGHMAASLDLLGRIRPMVSDQEQIESIRQQGIRLMNETFSRTYDDLISPSYELDLFEGELAKKTGRYTFDRLESTGLTIQYERFRLEGALSGECLSIAERLGAVTRGNAERFDLAAPGIIATE